MSDTLPEGTHALVMARVDRAKIRAAIGAGDPSLAQPLSLGGIELRVNPYMPEGVMAIEDRYGNLLGVVDTRGDHDPSFAPAGSRSVLHTAPSILERAGNRGLRRYSNHNSLMSPAHHEDVRR